MNDLNYVEQIFLEDDRTLQPWVQALARFMVLGFSFAILVVFYAVFVQGILKSAEADRTKHELELKKLEYTIVQCRQNKRQCTHE